MGYVDDDIADILGSEISVNVDIGNSDIDSALARSQGSVHSIGTRLKQML